ncbi:MULTISPECIES: MurR/RpiR family transcriptional regulator [unclassified Sutcliffiella]|uniref:MurR/RpiR family transcriptional regulator n=1 Tax=unclassified Sutcliffiella TaxID=2837532 RepID=UPI0030CBBE96
MQHTSGALLIIKEMIDALPPSERKIAEFILEFPEETTSLTASQLGERSKTSSAAVIRLCKSLGLKGFQQLKIKIAGDLHKKDQVDGYRDIKPGEPQSEVIMKMTNNSIQTLKETIDVIDKNELKKAVKAITNGENIHFFGVGASNIIAQDAQLKFIRINKHASAFTDFHMAIMHVANLKENDVVFGISFSGNTYEVEKVLELANKKGVTTISLTKLGSSNVASLAKIALKTSTSREATFRSGATSSRLAQLHVIDILFTCVANELYSDAIQHIDETREAIRSIRNTKER